METIHLGICCSAHDPAIAIIDDSGELRYAEATERSLQYKRGLNIAADYYPFVNKIIAKYVNENSQLVVAKNWSKVHHVNIRFAEIGLKLLLPALRLFPLTRLAAERYDYGLKLQNHVFSFAGGTIEREWKENNNIKNKFRHISSSKGLKKRYYDHHLCHAAAAAYSSPFDEAAVAVIDGYGEYTSARFYLFKNGNLKRIRSIKKSKNSLGFFYSFLCSACGFNPDLGEEWKVMGLAPFGKLIPELYDKLDKLIPVKNGSFKNPNLFFDISLYDKFMHKIVFDGNGKMKYAVEDIACTGQLLFETKIAQSLNFIYKETMQKNLVIAGGCALNSSSNGKISANTPFSNVYVYYAPGDDGTAVGAAILSFLSQNPVSSLNRKTLGSPYQGSEIEARSLEKAIKNCPYNYFLGEKKYNVTAKFLSTGSIVGWVQGRAEFGPRALGNRSILADPRKAEIKDIINLKLKYRENYRPFAPSIMEEYGEDIFEDYQPSYYMDKTLVIKKEYQEKIKGVTHVNGTGRLQSVNYTVNPHYYQLLREFKALTGIPVLLNTSFNLAGKPIVHTIEDIMASFFTSGITILVIGDYLFSKTPMEIDAATNTFISV